eukprot:m.52627 g.52627  ORF g.52627 m.52627 type:complete len:579 (+) comp7627_c1_seq1:64-1800(+)
MSLMLMMLSPSSFVVAVVVAVAVVFAGNNPFVCNALPASTTAANGISLKVNTTSIENGGWVELSWSGVPVSGKDVDDCFIAVISPPNVDISAIAPLDYPATAPWTKTAVIKYQYCHADPSFNATGSGSYNFSLLNMREDVAFVLFSGGIVTPKAEAKSPSISFTDNGIPRGIVLALTGNHDEMRVSWTADNNVGGALYYGIVGDVEKHTITADANTYTTDDLCGDPARTQGWRDPGYLYSVVIKGLKPGQQVWYQCINGDFNSEIHTFSVSQPANPKASVRILATADVGASEADKCHYHWEEPDASLTYGHLSKLTPADVLLHIGDVSYATGYSAKWDLFMQLAATVGQTTPIMTGLGNHEQDTPNKTFYDDNDSGGECGVPTTSRFIMPSKTVWNAWYSFEIGPVHFIMMDTELDCSKGSDQYNFFVEDLSKVNRSVTPWVIFSGHRSMYYLLGTGSFLDSNFAQFEDLLMKYEVDLALWGHYHNLLRTCPVYNQTCMEPKTEGGFAAPIHAVIGNGGMSLTPVPEKPADWTVYQNSVWGYSTIDANATTLHMQFFEDETNHLLHEFTISHPFPRPQ